MTATMKGDTRNYSFFCNYYVLISRTLIRKSYYYENELAKADLYALNRRNFVLYT